MDRSTVYIRTERIVLHRSTVTYISTACLGEGQRVGSDGAAGEEVHLEAGGGGQGGEQ